MRFELWAPDANRVDLWVAGRSLAMAPVGRGFWEADAAAGPGADYGFGLDGAEPLPDPRSPWQPNGVHGLSRVVDHAAHRWGDAGWRGVELGSAVFYELHVGTFTPEGTFDSAIARLDHLAALGITVVELMPVAEFSGRRGWGYDGVDLYAPCRAYGGPQALKRLVDACHARGLAVVMDVVYNHLGPEGNYLARFGPYFTGRYTTPWGSAVNLDGARSDPVREFLVGNALMWLRDYHFDGLRLDAVHAIVDTSAVHILEELATQVAELQRQLGRRLLLIAESDLNDPRLVRPIDAGGYGLDAQWSDDFHHSLHALLTGERSGYYADFGSTGDLAKALRQAFVYDGRYSEHRQRVHGRPPGDLPGTSFLAYSQNHDQVGNRATGERLAALTSTGGLKIAAALSLLSPFVPMIFQGEEWGASTPFQFFSDHQEHEVAAATSRGRVEEFAAFGWDPERVPDPQDLATFERSKLDWTELEREPHRELLGWYRGLLRMRATTPELRDGRRDLARVRHGGSERWLELERGPVRLRCDFDRLTAELG